MRTSFILGDLFYTKNPLCYKKKVIKLREKRHTQINILHGIINNNDIEIELSKLTDGQDTED